MTALARLACLVAMGLALCASATSPGRAADPDVPVAVTTWKGDPRLVFKWRRDVEFDIEERDGEARIRFLAPGKIDGKALAKAKAFAPRVVSGPQGDTVVLKLPPDRRLRPARSGRSIVVDVVPAPPRRTTVPLAADAAPPLPRPRPKPPGEAVATPASSLQRLVGSVVVRSSWQEHRHYIRFDWPRPVAAAVFRRGNWIWVVFDRALPVSFVNQKKAELIRPVAHPSATVFRVAAPSGFNPTMARVGSAWVVDLQDQALRPEHPVRVEPHPEASPPRIRFGLRLAASAPIEVIDPDLGERLLVVPNSELGEGLARNAAFVDFQALASAQGLVLQPTGQPLTIASTEDGVDVMARDGLVLARSAPSRAPVQATENPGRLLDLAAWAAPPGRHLEKRQALAAAAARAPETRRTAARLDLARFFFAEGFAPEAYGVLKAIERDDPGLFAQPGPRLLEGAAAFLAGRQEEAADALASRSLDGESEAAVWRAAVAASHGDWAAAALGFARSRPILSSYPRKIRHALSLAGARAAVAAGQGDAARSLLEPLLAEDPSPGDRGAALLLVARMHHQQGDIGKAVQIWNELAAGRDTPSRVAARLERTLALLDRKLIDIGAAIDQLEAVRSEWRGDEIEFLALRRLAALKAKSGDWRGSFEAFRQLETNFPGDKELPAVMQEAAAALAELFRSPAFADVPPLAAYKLFEQYAKLVPPGERRDSMAGPLVDRLAGIDLPAHAAGVIETQLTERAVDGETARLVTRLAALRLEEGKPEAALAALALPVGDIAPALAAERTYIEARALARQERAGDALALLGDDTTPAADRIRLEIFTRGKSWKEALPVYARLAPPVGSRLDAASARQVLNWATAATLAGDDDAVATIRETYGDRMEESQDRDSFRLVVGDPRSTRQKIAAAR